MSVTLRWTDLFFMRSEQAPVLVASMSLCNAPKRSHIRCGMRPSLCVGVSRLSGAVQSGVDDGSVHQRDVWGSSLVHLVAGSMPGPCALCHGRGALAAQPTRQNAQVSRTDQLPARRGLPGVRRVGSFVTLCNRMVTHAVSRTLPEWTQCASIQPWLLDFPRLSSPRVPGVWRERFWPEGQVCFHLWPLNV